MWRAAAACLVALVRTGVRSIAGPCVHCGHGVRRRSARALGSQALADREFGSRLIARSITDSAFRHHERDWLALVRASSETVVVDVIIHRVGGVGMARVRRSAFAIVPRDAPSAMIELRILSGVLLAEWRSVGQRRSGARTRAFGTAGRGASIRTRSERFLVCSSLRA